MQWIAKRTMRGDTKILPRHEGAYASGKPKSVTLSDVASRCNVSKATVSRVLRTPELVREKTRSRVQKALQESEYIYNAPGRGLAQRANGVMGLIVSGVEDASFGDILGSLQEMAVEHDMLISDTRYLPHVEIRLLQRMIERRAVAVVMLGHCIGTERAMREVEKNGGLLLLLWNLPEEEGFKYIAFDQARAVEQATDYLIGLGHKRIAFVIGPYDRMVGAKQRLDGFARSLTKHGMQMDLSYVHMINFGFSPEAGRMSMTRLLETSPRPTAVILASDNLAIGAYAAVRQAGLQIPRDISLIALDNIDFAPHMDPPLTTVNLSRHEMGRMAGTYLARLLNGEQVDCRIILPTVLMPRGSTAEVPE